MRKLLLACLALLSSSVTAQNTCWHPLGPTSLFDMAFATCHAQALPGNGWTHRFDYTQLSPKQYALVRAIAMVEQGLNSPADIHPGLANKVGDEGAAHGPLQVHKSAFLDARQAAPWLAPDDSAYPKHVEHTCWQHDMSIPEKALYRALWWANSVGVWFEYSMRYGYHDMLYMDAAAAERIARRWNGGPNGDTKSATKPYWEKVREKLLTHFPGVIPGL
jgi:hypothetical protein